MKEGTRKLMRIARTAVLAAAVTAGLAPGAFGQEGAPEITPEIEKVLDCGAAFVREAAEGARQGMEPEQVETYDIDGHALLELADGLLAEQGFDYDARYEIGVEYGAAMSDLLAGGGEPEFEPEECRALLIGQAVGYDTESLLVCGSAFAWAGANMTRQETGFAPEELAGWGDRLLARAGSALVAEGFTQEQRDILIADYGARVGRVVGAGDDPDRTLPFCRDLADRATKGG